MNASTQLTQAIADALVESHGEDAIDWLDNGGRAAVEREVAQWNTSIAKGAWLHQPADILVLRALRHVEHVVELKGDAHVQARLNEMVDDEQLVQMPGAKIRIGEVFAHAVLRGDTGEPLEPIEPDWREHGSAVRGEDDEQPWDSATPLSGNAARVEACLVEARYVERRVPFAEPSLPERVRQAKALADTGDKRGWTMVDDSPVFRYVRWIREDGEERMVPPSLRLRTVYLFEMFCPNSLLTVISVEGLRGQIEGMASYAVESARAKWRVGPTKPISIRRIEYDIDEKSVPVPPAYQTEHRLEPT